MTNQIVIQEMSADLLTADAENEIKLSAKKLMRLATGNRRLNANQATELAVFCWMTQLNPYNQEAYHAGDNIGIIVGVQGVRRKANEYLAITSDDPNDRFFVTHREALPGEATFDPELGDIAQVATVKIRSYSDHWRSELLRLFTEFKEAGMNAEKAYERAESLAGSEPQWQAAAVVDHREKFDRDPDPKKPDDKGSPDKWDRVERCKKRAEKWALRKAFPTMILPDAELGDSSIIDPNVIEGIVRDVTTEITAGQLTEHSEKSETQLLGELGFEIEDEPKDSEPELKPKSEPKKNGKSWDKEFVDALINAKPQIATNPHNAVAILNFFNPENLDEAVKVGGIYRKFREKGLDSQDAVKKTLEGETP
jgi:hypothetical protein